MTGNDTVGGLQLEVVALRIRTVKDLGGKDKTHLLIIVKDEMGDELFSEVKPMTVLGRLFQAYCQKQKLNPKTMRFFKTSEGSADGRLFSSMTTSLFG